MNNRHMFAQERISKYQKGGMDNKVLFSFHTSNESSKKMYLSNRIAKICSLLKISEGRVVVLLDDVAAFQVNLAEEGHGHGIAGFGRLSEIVHRLTVIHLRIF